MRVREITVNKTLPPTFSFDAFLPGDQNDYLFFDIETLGFHRISHPVALIGMATIKNGSLHLKQWLCDSPSEEKDLLEHFFQVINENTILVSFNGSRFDWSFLVSRAKKNRVLPPQPKFHLDLFQFFQGGFPYLKAPSHTLRALTQEDRPFHSIDSKNVPEIMRKHFVGAANTTDLDALFLHNEEDLLALFILDDRMENIHEKWQIRLENGHLAMDSIRTTNDYYLVRYRPSNLDFLASLVIQEKNYSIDWIQSEGLLEIKFRYLAVENQDTRLHLLPEAWYPFHWTADSLLFSEASIPTNLKIIKKDESIDHFLVHTLCRAALEKRS